MSLSAYKDVKIKIVCKTVSVWNMMDHKMAIHVTKTTLWCRRHLVRAKPLGQNALGSIWISLCSHHKLPVSWDAAHMSTSFNNSSQHISCQVKDFPSTTNVSLDLVPQRAIILDRQKRRFAVSSSVMSSQITKKDITAIIRARGEAYTARILQSPLTTRILL